MTKALSLDLRRRVVAAVDAGASRRAVAARYGVAPSTAVRWHRQWRESGSLAPRPQGGHQGERRSVERFADAIRTMVAKTKDITLAEIAERLEAEHGERFAPTTIHAFFRRHRMSWKKNRARRRASA